VKPRRRLRTLASLVLTPGLSASLPFVSLDAVESGTGRLAVDLPERAADEAGIAAVEPGDVLFGKLRPYLAKSWLVDRPALASTELLAIRPGKELKSRYLAYVVQSLPFLDWAISTSEGTKMPRTSWESVSDYRILLPPEAAQRRIADYLDAETARIDALLEKKVRLIELLEERRMSVMTEGVSGLLIGLPQRESSLHWLPTLSEHWGEVRLRLVARLGSGHTPSRSHPEWWVDCSLPWITTGEVARLRSDRDEYVYETRERISALGMANSSAELHPAGTVALCRTASAGYSGIMATDMATSQDFATWTCGPALRPRFLLLCLRAMRQDLLGRLAMGSTHQTIYMPDIESLRIPMPNVQEQDRVVEAVWRQLGQIDAASTDLDRQLALITEHRQALITAAVTGELPIPGVAA
jgi:type I restriction enzyme, S subunit